MRRRAPRAAFRPDIEGLRAVAVVAVVAFHAHLPLISGGFAGVDVFFVISGFLITRLLWAEVSTTGGVGLAAFYGARARRLLPAAGTVLMVTAVGAAVLLPPLAARSVLGDGLASALYVGNYRSPSMRPTIWPRRCRRRSSTTGRWVSRNSSTCCGRR